MKKIILSGALAMLMAAPALAQDGAPPPADGKGRLAAIDTNGDGKVEKSEFLAKAQERAEKMFAKLDANGDGVITPDEFKAMHDKMKERGPRGGQGAGKGDEGGDQFP
jgi:hypothetical protein